MPLDLSSLQAKFDRSEEHFQAIEDKFVAWKNGNFCSLETKANAKFTEWDIIYRCSKEPDLRELSLIFGDCIHNMRSVLDHLVYAIAVHESGKNPPPGWDRLAFPIVECDDSFNGFNKGKFGNKKTGERFISDDVVAAIRLVQPDKREHGYLPPLLRLLREFDDADKHRLLHLAVAQPVQWQYDGVFEGLGPESGRAGFVPYDPWELKDNTKIATVVTDGPAPDLNLKGFKLSTGIVVSHEAGPSGTTHSQIQHVIEELGWEVGFVVESVISKVK